MSVAHGISLEEYLHTEYQPDCDFVDGVLEERNVGQRPHSRTQKRLLDLLTPLAERFGLEPLPEQRVRVSATRVRVPDVCLTPVSAESLVQEEPPELCVEILSPDDRIARIRIVVNDYIAFGVPVIWIINPYDRTAFMATKECPWEVCDELRWGDVVIPLSEILREI